MRIADFLAHNSEHRSLTEKQVLDAVLDKLEFARDQKIEHRLDELRRDPTQIGTQNAKLKKDYTGITAHGHTIVLVSSEELKVMQWSHPPIPKDIKCIPFKVHPTDHRDDSDGEFIIRLSDAARQLLPSKCKFVVVQSVTSRLPAPAGNESLGVPKVIAAVRPLSPKDKNLIGRDDIGFCQLDMVLRVSIGVRAHNFTDWWPLSEDTGNAEYVGIAPLIRSRVAQHIERGDEPATAVDLKNLRCVNIRPSAVGSKLGYQWLPFRVHRALDGDFETPICRVRPQYLSSLGIHDGGVVVMESVAESAIRRLLPADEKQAEAVIDFDGEKGVARSLRFEKQLGVEDELRIPFIYMDYSTREHLEVVPGQVVWVRRELFSVFLRELLKIASALALALMGIAFSVRALFPPQSRLGDALLVTMMVVSGAMLLWSAYHECRNAVRSE